MGLAQRISVFGDSFVEELQEAIASPQSIDHQVETARTEGADKHRPDKKKLERYWELYTSVPLIRQPIRSFASEVVAPGYYVDAENEDLKEDLEDWLRKSSIVAGEVDKDFSLLLKKATIQREVKGTSLVEKVPTDEGNLYGFKLMRPETVRAFTYPGQNVLLDPDDEMELPSDPDLSDHTELYETADGQLAAYVQQRKRFFDSPRGNSDSYVAFTRDEVIKLTRDEDTGFVFGTSRLEAVEDRIESLLKKLDDADKGIESMASPFQLFKFGNPDNPWERSKVKNFMKNHRPEEFEPGMKQGVQGDIEVETVAGETPDIDSFLDFDINWIISEMPLPKYALGGFEEDVNQFVSRSQETRTENQIQEARQEIEYEWTPVLREKAEELGYNPDDVNSLVIGEDPDDLGLADLLLRDDDGEGGNEGAGGTDFTRPPASTEDQRQQNEEDEELLFDELARIQEAGATDDVSELADVTYQTLQFVRDRLIEKIEEYGRDDPLRALEQVAERRETVIESEMERMFRAADTAQSENVFQSVLESTRNQVEELGVDASTSLDDTDIVGLTHDTYVASVRDAADDISSEIKDELRRVLAEEQDISVIRDRISDQFSDGKIRNRAELIAYMETFNAQESLKLRRFRQADDVVGVAVVSDQEELTPVCRQLTGVEGTQAVAVFDHEDSISEQFSRFVSDRHLHEGFDPLPNSGPFHYFCGSRLEPIFEEDLSEYQESIEVIM